MKWFNRLNQLWYGAPSVMSLVLTPFAELYKSIVIVRRKIYHYFARRLVTHFKVPVIVVGNITVGGTGKTPLVIWLTQFLQEQGYRPGIVSRGYSGKATCYPHLVSAEDDPLIWSDEAVLLARLSRCPVVVDPNRVNAVKHLLSMTDCNIVISDDGLQHYALGREIEIAVVDNDRRFGNERCLPAGPMREPLSRLDDVDFIIANGKAKAKACEREYAMHLVPGAIYNLMEPSLKATPDAFMGHPLHAIAGIGHPERFFKELRHMELSIWPHSFPDHHRFTLKDIQFEDDAKVIMTEKDAVKCKNFVDYRYWCLPVTAVVDPVFGDVLLKKLKLIAA